MAQEFRLVNYYNLPRLNKPGEWNSPWVFPAKLDGGHRFIPEIRGELPCFLGRRHRRQRAWGPPHQKAMELEVPKCLGPIHWSSLPRDHDHDHDDNDEDGSGLLMLMLSMVINGY